MTIAASGPLAISALRTEFGGSAPDSISEYYRGAGLVPDIAANAAIPTSGAISLSNFYNSTNQDITPDALNWTDISASGAANGITNDQTIAGINEPITLSLTYGGGINEDISMQVRLNGASFAFVTIASGGTFVVNNGDVVRFRSQRPGGSGFDSDFVTVTNVSDGSTALDSFSVSYS